MHTAAAVVAVLFLCFTGAFSARVHVPGRGLVDSACVHELPSGSSIVSLEDGSHHVTLPGGETKLFPPCEQASVAQPSPKGPQWRTWTEYSTNTSQINYFSGYFTVPHRPRASGQTLFFWLGVEDASRSEVLQPVLQFGPSGAGGGAYYALASWFVTSTNNFHSTLVRSAPGHVIEGTLIATGNKWHVEAFDVTTGYNASLFHTLRTPVYESKAYCTLEAASFSSCSQYPAAQRAIQFSSLKLLTTSGRVQPHWQAGAARGRTCQEHAVVSSSSQVSLYFNSTRL